MSCIICNSQAERHHIRSRGASGSDHPDNIMEICRQHHQEIHKIGRNSFIIKYSLQDYMINKNWYYDTFYKKWFYNGLQD